MGNLPAGGTRFVGRERESREATAALRRGRLLTLTGDPGVGKTRLALRVAERARRSYPDGVWFVELGPLRDGELLTSAVADTLGICEMALGVRDHASRSLIDVLIDQLADKRMLLVLDNCEHLLDSCARLTHTLLRAGRDLRILTTSRQTLGVTGEQVLPVRPLPVPDPEQMPSLEAVSGCDAVRLFTDRAASASRRFRVTEDNSTAILRLCHRLDGNPLAIELAAVRVRAMPVDRVLQRLDDYFGLLSEGSHVHFPRLQAPRTAIDWSFGLCSPAQRTLWRRLAVFRGGFDLEDAEAVCAGDGIAAEEVLDLLTDLIDMSIVVREPSEPVVRYRLPEMIREYGQEMLARSEEGVRVRERHCDHYLSLAEHAMAEFMSPRQALWLSRLRLAHPDLRAAADHSLTAPGDGTIAPRIAAPLGRYCMTRGLLSEGRHWLREALDHGPVWAPARADALWIAGWLALLQGDTVAGTRLLRECQDHAGRIGHARAQRRAVHLLGLAALVEGRFERARTLLDQAFESDLAAGDPDGQSLTLFHLTLAHTGLGDDESAVAAAERSLAICREHGATWSESHALWAAGVAGWRHGDSARAGLLLRDALGLKHTLCDRWGLALCLEALAWTMTDADAEVAARLLGAANGVWRSIGSSPDRIQALTEFHRGCEARLREVLGPDRFGRAFHAGAALPLDDAVAFGLGRPSPACS
ncbi:AAA family ATPase [Actinoallomurus purpureus]|uniref:ATP-binding protein n=1 Tax=Actinoallomurus purpureus TaxID=478114 RepID=UPI002092820E|nr:AAA family ATPase [Actinoallomurus purpureus]MCO6003742.1 AAA family ATPase [Actinoallomurus purpureus]